MFQLTNLRVDDAVNVVHGQWVPRTVPRGYKEGTLESTKRVPATLKALSDAPSRTLPPAASPVCAPETGEEH